MSELPNVTELSDRLDQLLTRIASAEAAYQAGPWDELLRRQLLIITRISSLQTQLGITTSKSNEEQPSSAPVCDSPVMQRLVDELRQKGINSYRFVRAPGDYYERSLEYRQGIVGAHSIHHLCKSLIITNTRLHPSIQDDSNIFNCKYYVVIIQYTTRFHAEKLKNFLHKSNAGKYGKQFFNMRQAPEDVSDELSGYGHNAVTPIAMRTKLPIIMSHRIMELMPDFFWLGAGEVDLKIGMPAKDFVKAYEPLVVDCTYEGYIGLDGVKMDS